MLERSTIETSDGVTLETRIDSPDHPERLTVFCHPHPQHGGSMNAPLMISVTGRLVDRGHRVVRFNFRGTGNSGGSLTIVGSRNCTMWRQQWLMPLGESDLPSRDRRMVLRCCHGSEVGSPAHRLQDSLRRNRTRSQDSSLSELPTGPKANNSRHPGTGHRPRSPDRVLRRPWHRPHPNSRRPLLPRAGKANWRSGGPGSRGLLITQHG